MRTNELAAAIVSNVAEGRAALHGIVEFLNEIWAQRETITPIDKERKRPPAIFIYRLLPKTNCGKCGELSCLAFVTRLSLADKDVKDCTHLSGEQLIQLEKILDEA